MRMPSKKPLSCQHFQILRRRRQQSIRAAKQSATPSSNSSDDGTGVDNSNGGRKEQRPSSSTVKMGAKMSSYATNPASYYYSSYSSSNSKSKEEGGSSTSPGGASSSPAGTSTSAKVAGGNPDSTGSNPTDGLGVKMPSAPSDLDGGRPFASHGSSSNDKATQEEDGNSLNSSSISKRQKASALLLLAAATPGLTNEEEGEDDEYDVDVNTINNVGGDNSKSDSDGWTAGADPTLGSAGSGRNDGSVFEAASECCARLLFSGTAEGIGIEALKVDDDGDDDKKEEIVVEGTNIGVESQDDEERKLTIGGISGIGSGGGSSSVSTSTILQTLLGGGGVEGSGNTASTATSTAATATAPSSKNLGHIGDGRRTAKAKVRIGSGGSGDDAVDEGSKGDAKSKANSKAKVKPSSAKAAKSLSTSSTATNGTQEMPIQMMTSRRIVTQHPTNQRLSREVRGLIASAGDAENVHPNTSTTNANNAKKGGSGLGKPLTRSKAKLQQQKQTQKSVPPHLLQEHPSVRNKPTNAGSTKTKSNTGTKSSSGIGGGGLTSPAIVPAPSHLATPNNPRVVTINGCRVTMIDDDRKVFVIDAVTPEMCDRIRTMTDDYVRETALTNPNKQTWRTLYTYTKMDLPCGEVTGLMKKAVDGIMKNVVSVVGAVYGNKKAAAKLKPRSWKEPHLLHYQVLPGKPEHLGIEMHYDGCDFTWSLMLSGNGEYEGGGTYIRCLRKTIMLKQGQILVHPGELVSVDMFALYCWRVSQALEILD